MEWRAERLRQKEGKRTKGSLDEPMNSKNPSLQTAHGHSPNWAPTCERP